MDHFRGPCLTLAGPGSGKTHTLTRRIRHLICRHQVPPEQILVITFTRAAAAEMRQRFCALMGEELPVAFGTFHSIFYRILQEEYDLEADALVTGKARQQLLREAVSQCHVQSKKKDFFSVLSRELSYMKNAGFGVSGETYHSAELPSVNLGEVYEAYEKLKSAYGLLDYDDLLTRTLELFQKHPEALERWRKRFSFFLLDEAQDMNLLQLQVIRLLAYPENNLFLVGDDDQSIYAFRGADPGLMLNFVKWYPGCHRIVLRENYRSKRKVVEAAGRLISHNGERFAKEITGVETGEGVVEYREYENAAEEAEQILQMIRDLGEEGYAPEEMAVLFRSHGQMEALAGALAGQKIPFYRKEGMPNPYDHWVLRDAEAYLRLAQAAADPAGMDRELLLRIMNRPSRYLARASLGTQRITFAAWKEFYRGKDWIQERIGTLEDQLKRLGKLPGFAAVHYIRKTIGYDRYLAEYRKEHPQETGMEEALKLLEELAKGTRSARKLLERLESARQSLSEENQNRRERTGIGLYTIHGAKGLEFSVVFLPGCNEGEVPSKNAKTRKQMEEERRIFYVGITRAKERLYVSWVRSGDRDKKYPSRFIREMREG